MRQKGIAHLFLLVVVVIVGIGAIGYLAYQNAQLRNVTDVTTTHTEKVNIPTTTSDAESFSPTSSPASDWKTYTNLSANYSIQYPSPWSVINFGLMEAEPADETTKYVRFRYQPDLSKSKVGFDVKEVNTIDVSNEIKFNEERDIGTEKTKCGSTGDGMTTFCWLKTPDESNYLIFTISNYQKTDDNVIINQILSTFKFVE